MNNVGEQIQILLDSFAAPKSKTEAQIEARRRQKKNRKDRENHKRKKHYTFFADAWNNLLGLQSLDKRTLVVYKCPVCSQFLVGHVSKYEDDYQLTYLTEEEIQERGVNMGIKYGAVLAPKHTNTFVAVLHFMHGDADEYTDEEMTFGTEQEVIEFKQALDWLHEQDPHYDRLGAYADRTGERMEQIKRDPHYTRWFCSYQPADFEEDRKESWWKHGDDYTYNDALNDDALNDGWGEDLWPDDNQYRGGNSPAAFQYATFFWYDAQGNAQKIEVE